MKKWAILLILCLAALALSACGPNALVLVTDQDKGAVEKLIAPYTQKAGVQVTVVQTSGIDDLLRAVGANDQGGNSTATPPPSDGEVPDIVLTQSLEAIARLRAGNVLAQYAPPSSSSLPSGARGQGYWYGFGGRGWVLARNTDLVPDAKMTDSFEDLADDSLPATKVGIPSVQIYSYYPLAIFTFWGQEQTLAFYQTLMFKQTQMSSSPKAVADRLAEGRLALGLTTYAEAKALKDGGKPVDYGFPDSAEGEIGSYVELNCVALTAASKKQKLAQPLEDYLLSPEAEALSIELGLSDVALRDNDKGAPVVRPLNLSPEKVLASAGDANEMIRQMQ